MTIAIIVLLSLFQKSEVIQAVDFRLMNQLSKKNVYVEINEVKVTFINMKTGRPFLVIDKKKAKKTYVIQGVEAIVVDKVLTINENKTKDQ